MPAEGAPNVTLAEPSASAFPTPAAPTAPVKVWDPFVRAFHWLLVGGILANYFELVRAGRFAHQVIGYGVLVLVAARLLWGFVGSRHARFADFVRRPSAAWSHLRAAAAHRDRRYVGHNPAGGLMVLALLGAILAVGATGWLSRTDWFFSVKWMETLHGLLANALFGLACLHVLGVLHGSWRHRENLVLSMLTGRKRVTR